MGEPQKGYINYSIVVRKEGKQYSCWCPELDVASSGDSIEQATKNLEDAVNCLLETYAELGELTQLLDEKGISLNSETKHAPVFLAEARVSVPTTS
jgi:predicted RNase H-like HicB family nuclease